MPKRPWLEHPRVVAARQRSRVVDLAVRTLDGFRRHQTGRNAAVLAYYGFVSIFPLLLVLTTILGFVLHGNESLQQKIIDGALSHIPIIGQQIASDPSKLSGNVVALVLGLLTSLWSGMRAFVGLQAGLNDTADVPIDERPPLPVTRLRALIGIGVVGVSQIGTATLQTLVAVGATSLVVKLLLLLATLVTNVVVLAVIYRWLCNRRQGWHDVWPGAIAGGVLFTALQLIGVTIVGRAVAKASPVYGTFAGVIALLGWLSVHAMVTMLGAELNRAIVLRGTHHDELKAVPA